MTAAILSSLTDSKHCVSNVVILMLKVIAQCKMGSFLTFINTLVQHKKSGNIDAGPVYSPYLPTVWHSGSNPKPGIIHMG